MEKSELRALAGYVSWAEDQIARVFNDNKLPGRFLQGYQTPQLLVWHFVLDELSKSAVDRALGLETALGVALQVDGVRVGKHGGGLTVEVPSPRRVILPVRALPMGRGLRVCLGRDLQFRPFWLDFERFPHLLVLGSTKIGGKSETLRTVVWSLARQNARRDVAFCFIDLKGGIALNPFADLAHNLFEVATDVEEASHLVLWLLQEMEQRLNGKVGPHIFVVIDEVFRLVKEWPGADTGLGELTAVARGASIHVIAATQRASKETLGSTLVGSNIVDRICGRVDNASSSFWALTVEKAGAEKLLGNGDVLAWVGRSLTRVQVGKVGRRDVARLPQGGGRRPIPRMEEEVAETEHQWGGHNKVPLEEEWIRWFQEGGSINGARTQFGLSASVAYRAQAEALSRNGGSER